MPAINSSHWDEIVDTLSAGPIEDEAGLATQKLLEVTGHNSTNALTKLLRRMEDAGVIVRDIQGRRTTRIALAPGQRPKRSRRQRAEPYHVDTVSTPAPATNGDGGVDYDLLAAALLAKALKSTQAQEASASAKDALVRAERAEAARKIAEADALAARARVADLESQVRSLEKNVEVLMAQADRPAARAGDTIRQRLSKQEQRELDELAQMLRQPPSRRG